MAIDKPIEGQKFNGHLTEQRRDNNYSAITYSIYSFTVNQPEDKEFDTDISYLIEKLFENGTATGINSNSLRIDFRQNTKDLKYLGHLFLSSVYLELSINRESDSDARTNPRGYSISINLICDTRITDSVRERIESTLYPIINKYADSR